MPINFFINVLPQFNMNNDEDRPATIDPGNLQWGYRIYGEGYMLETDPMLTDCS